MVCFRPDAAGHFLDFSNVFVVATGNSEHTLVYASQDRMTVESIYKFFRILNLIVK